MTTLKVAEYLRISLDQLGVGASIASQQQDTGRLAQAKGWTGTLYKDESKSAYNRRVRRPRFEAMLEDLHSGVIQGVVVYDIDRLARQPRDLERLIDLYEANPKLVFATCQGEIDLCSSDGRFMARMMVNVANKSSADTARRVARSHLSMAQKGIPVGGSRPFGWMPDKLKLHPVEAPLIVAAATAVIGGIGLNTIAREWNTAGVTSPRGNPWSRQALRQVMLSPRLAGYRVHQGEIAVNASGAPVVGLYEPILSVETWQTVCAVITDPAKTGQHVHAGGRKYLLSGVVRCGLCLSLLYGNADTKHNTFRYACNSYSCSRVTINGPRTDAIVAKVALAYLADREVEPDNEPWPLEAELADVMARKAELMTAFTRKQLKGDVVFPAVADLENQSAALRNNHASWLRTQVRNTITTTAEQWPELTVDERRAVVEKALPGVVIHPQKKHGPVFDRDRIEVWTRSDSTQSG